VDARFAVRRRLGDGRPRLRSYLIRPDFQAARLGRLEVTRAHLRGWSDGRRVITVPSGNQPLNGNPEEAWTPFIGHAHDLARAASNQMVTWLLERHGALVQKIYKQAQTVVREHDTDGHPTAGSHGRLVESLSAWRVETAAARARAEAAADRSNLLIQSYWQGFRTGYARASSRGRVGGRGANLSATVDWRPGKAVIDPFWDKPDPLLLLTYGTADDDQATTDASRILLRAMDIMANCRCPACTSHLTRGTSE
jgi:hypothetical protein